jgi:hypothetical protein
MLVSFLSPVDLDVEVRFNIGAVLLDSFKRDLRLFLSRYALESARPHLLLERVDLVFYVIEFGSLWFKLVRFYVFGYRVERGRGFKCVLSVHRK